MLQQMSEATLTLLLTMLAVGAAIRFMPAAGHGRRGKKARQLAVWFGIAAGAIASVALTIINVEAPKSVNRQTVGLYTLPIAVVLALIFLSLLALRSRRVRSLLPTGDAEARAQSSTETPVPGDTLVRLVGALFIAFALFRSVPTALNQAVMMLSGGVEIYSTQAVSPLSDTGSPGCPTACARGTTACGRPRASCVRWSSITRCCSCAS